VLAWGDNTFGQLGDGTFDGSVTPVAVKLPPGVKVVAVRCGGTHSLALTSTGQVLAWGLNEFGELGDGNLKASDVPVRVRLPAGTKVKAISGGTLFSLALTTTGKVLAWGYNPDGQLGDGTTKNSDIPVTVKLPAGVKMTGVAAGGWTSLALVSGGTKILAWGFGRNGELGDGHTTSSTLPVRVKLPQGVTVKSLAGGGPNLALTTTGQVLAWGGNSEGALGDGTTTNSDIPVRVKLPAGMTARSVAAGAGTGMALTTTGRVLAWGSNNYGQLGIDSNITDILTPERVKLPAGLAASVIASGNTAYFGLAIVH
jgi:alpha-tubulin suppressor-like RCC1 family protein